MFLSALFQKLGFEEWALILTVVLAWFEFRLILRRIKSNIIFLVMLVPVIVLSHHYFCTQANNEFLRAKHSSLTSFLSVILLVTLAFYLAFGALKTANRLYSLVEGPQYQWSKHDWDYYRSLSLTSNVSLSISVIIYLML